MKVFQLTDLASGDIIGTFATRDFAVSSLFLSFPDLLWCSSDTNQNDYWTTKDGDRLEFYIEEIDILDAPINFNELKE